MGWMPDFSYQKNRDSDKDSFKFMKKKVKKNQGPLGVRLDKAIKGMADVKQKPKGLV